MGNEKKIEKYHFEELIYILLILTSDLSAYEDDDLISFAESIEGRIEVLFTKGYLMSLNKEFGINGEIIIKLEDLRILVSSLYEAQWHKKLKGGNRQIIKIKQKASDILGALRVEYNEPKRFSEQHLNIDWN